MLITLLVLNVIFFRSVHSSYTLSRTRFLLIMEEPVFIKCEPGYVSGTAELNNADCDVMLPTEEQTDVKAEPENVFYKPFIKEEIEIQDMKIETNDEEYNASVVSSKKFLLIMEEPVFIKCEPGYVSDTAKLHNADHGVKLLTEEQTDVKTEPEDVFYKPFIKEELEIQDMKIETSDEEYNASVVPLKKSERKRISTGASPHPRGDMGIERKRKIALQNELLEIEMYKSRLEVLKLKRELGITNSQYTKGLTKCDDNVEGVYYVLTNEVAEEAIV
ncbi:uncharacterized protein [Anabrus simplex]|uniref:uncharacterized protein isoform X2 n=1 Tax=Anabrus simplex TaxID=316456 RepID=UPI0035A276E8